jgi:hypothetical protein
MKFNDSLRQVLDDWFKIHDTLSKEQYEMLNRFAYQMAYNTKESASDFEVKNEHGRLILRKKTKKGVLKKK